MKHETFTCDIERDTHDGDIVRIKVPVMFDHDQDDGKSKTKPCFEMKELDLCLACFNEMTEKRILIYAYGAMGHNNYSL